MVDMFKSNFNQKIFLLFLVSTQIFAWSLIGGVNTSTIKYNKSVPWDVLYQFGFIAGLEKSIRISKSDSSNTILKSGLIFVQRGVSNQYKHQNYKLNSSEIYNYFNGYILYPLSFLSASNNTFKSYIGLQSGFSIGGKTELETNYYEPSPHEQDFSSIEESEIKLGDLNFDYGLLLAADYAINNKIGLRLNYYLGFSNIDKDANTINAKNRGIALTCVYNW